VKREIRGDVADMASVVGEVSFFLGIPQSQTARTYVHTHRYVYMYICIYMHMNMHIFICKSVTHCHTL